MMVEAMWDATPACALCHVGARPWCRKEALWPYVREFSDRAIYHIEDMLHRLRDSGTKCELYAVHGHYADAGESASLIASTLNSDMLMTGHSLGRNKLEHLRASGALSNLHPHLPVLYRLCTHTCLYSTAFAPTPACILPLMLVCTATVAAVAVGCMPCSFLFMLQCCCHAHAAVL
jgi:hypothetical protein